MKKLYQSNYTDEGILWRKGDVTILKPTANIPYWKVRIAGGKKGKPLEDGEGDFYKNDTRKAFRAGNKLNRKLKKNK